MMVPHEKKKLINYIRYPPYLRAQNPKQALRRGDCFRQQELSKDDSDFGQPLILRVTNANNSVLLPNRFVS